MELLCFKSELTAAPFPELPFIMIKNIEGFILQYMLPFISKVMYAMDLLYY